MAHHFSCVQLAFLHVLPLSAWAEDLPCVTEVERESCLSLKCLGNPIQITESSSLSEWVQRAKLRKHILSFNACNIMLQRVHLWIFGTQKQHFSPYNNANTLYILANTVKCINMDRESAFLIRSVSSPNLSNQHSWGAAAGSAVGVCIGVARPVHNTLRRARGVWQGVLGMEEPLSVAFYCASASGDSQAWKVGGFWITTPPLGHLAPQYLPRWNPTALGHLGGGRGVSRRSVPLSSYCGHFTIASILQ